MRLIDADALKKEAYPFPCAIGVEYAVTLRQINEAPSIYAEPVQHGRWEHGMQCPFCKQIDTTKPNYCCNCGAKMDGGD